MLPKPLQSAAAVGEDGAQAFGTARLPSVLSDIPANAQLIDAEVHGLRVALRDEPAIANALQRLWQDPVLRADMGAAARSRVLERFSTDPVLSRYEELFDETLGRLQGSGAPTPSSSG